jgi:hypothetical protein
VHRTHHQFVITESKGTDRFGERVVNTQRTRTHSMHTASVSTLQDYSWVKQRSSSVRTTGCILQRQTLTTDGDTTSQGHHLGLSVRSFSRGQSEFFSNKATGR